MYHMSENMGQNTNNLLSIILMPLSYTDDVDPFPMVLSSVLYIWLVGGL